MIQEENGGWEGGTCRLKETIFNKRGENSSYILKIRYNYDYTLSGASFFIGGWHLFFIKSFTV